jgi:carbon-monoxide dehydrogenase medium subunit
MIPAPFEYEIAESVEHASELLGQNADAKLLAGGHSLLPAMRLRIARPSLLIDLGRLRDLSYIREDGDRIAIGALTRHYDVQTSDLLREQCGLLPFTAAFVGDPQVRHRGTVGGSVAHGDPASDMPTALLALDAEFVVRGPDGERTVPAADFFVSVFETALRPQDVLTEIRVPKTGSSGHTYKKFYRRAQDWATVAVAAVRVDGGVNVGLTSMGATPLRAPAVEEALRGGADAAAAAEHAAEGTSPPTDTNGTSEYRQAVAKVLVRRALEEVLAA